MKELYITEVILKENEHPIFTDVNMKSLKVNLIAEYCNHVFHENLGHCFCRFLHLVQLKFLTLQTLCWHSVVMG